MGVIAVFMVLGVYLVLLVYARRVDRKNREKVPAIRCARDQFCSQLLP